MFRAYVLANDVASYYVNTLCLSTTPGGFVIFFGLSMVARVASQSSLDAAHAPRAISRETFHFPANNAGESYTECAK